MKIKLSNGQHTLVDKDDYDYLINWEWHMYNGYAVRYENNRIIYMHHVIQERMAMEANYERN